MPVLSVLLAVLSAVCNGSFGSLSKVERCREVHPYIFNFWTCAGIVVSSALLLATVPRTWVFEPWALLSGFLFTISTANAFMAIATVGLSVGSGVWCGTAVLVSFVWGVFVQQETVANLPLAIAALAILLAGITGIAAAGHLSSTRRGGEEGSMDSDVPLLGNAPAGREGALGRALGLFSAMSAGAFGGLVLAPMGFAPDSHQGLAFVPSMGLGVLLAGPAVTGVLVWADGTAGMLVWADGTAPALNAAAAALPGVLAGSVWNIGNAASILAVGDPSVGLALAYPIMQCGLAVAGLWGVLLFKEITGRAQTLYWLSTVVLICGASLLTLSKQ